MRNLREGKQKKTYKKTGVLEQTKKNDYIKYLKTKYLLKNSNVIPYGEKKYDNFHSELLLFKKKWFSYYLNLLNLHFYILIHIKKL